MNAANVIPLSPPQPFGYGKSASPAALNPSRVRFGPFELDEANARLSRDGTAVTLAPRPFGLLCALARRPGSLLAKHALLDAVWGHRFVSESVLKTAISDLRTVLDDDPPAAALHRNRVAAWLSLHCRDDGDTEYCGDSQCGAGPENRFLWAAIVQKRL